MSAEYSIMHQRNASALSRGRAAYAAACNAVAVAQADDCALREVQAPDTVLLESRQGLERTKLTLADARAGLIQAAWADGQLANEVDLAEAVSTVLAAAAT